MYGFFLAAFGDAAELLKAGPHGEVPARVVSSWLAVCESLAAVAGDSFNPTLSSIQLVPLRDGAQDNSVLSSGPRLRQGLISTADRPSRGRIPPYFARLIEKSHL
jgi:hypothetical protein